MLSIDYTKCCGEMTSYVHEYRVRNVIGYSSRQKNESFNIVCKAV